MADSAQPAPKWQKLANEAGFSGALSIYLHFGAIHWLSAPAPDNAVLMVLVPAGATVLAGLGRAAAWCWRTFSKRKEPDV